MSDGRFEAEKFNAFFRAIEPLKDTLRSAKTAKGRSESTAEHTWRLCVITMMLRHHLPDDVDANRLLSMLLIHDLGEAIHGDIPAPLQTGDKSNQEREAITELADHLPKREAEEMVALWEEYNAAETPVAKMAKALDRYETVLQHIQGCNDPDFDYAFNLGYGHEHTDAQPLVRALRAPIDAETRKKSHK